MSKMRAPRVSIRGLVVAVGTVIGIALAMTVANTASAHDSSHSTRGCGPVHLSTCGSGGVRNNHTEVFACDEYADGFSFVTYYKLSPSGSIRSVSDPNGSASGCGVVIVTTSDAPVYNYQVCSIQSLEVCSTWWIA